MVTMWFSGDLGMHIVLIELLDKDTRVSDYYVVYKKLI